MKKNLAFGLGQRSPELIIELILKTLLTTVKLTEASYFVCGCTVKGGDPYHFSGDERSHEFIINTIFKEEKFAVILILDLLVPHVKKINLILFVKVQFCGVTSHLWHVGSQHWMESHLFVGMSKCHIRSPGYKLKTKTFNQEFLRRDRKAGGMSYFFI